MEKTRESETRQIDYTQKQGCNVSMDLNSWKDFCDHIRRQPWTSDGCLSMLDVKYMSRESLHFPLTVKGNQDNSFLFTFVRKQCVKNTSRLNKRSQVVISQFMDHVTKIIRRAWLHYPSMLPTLRRFHIQTNCPMKYYRKILTEAFFMAMSCLPDFR